MNNIRTLNVWEKARSLEKEIYLISKIFPKEDVFGITSQMRRSSQSITSNIAEGCGRNTDKDLCRFLVIANGSAFELESQLVLCNDIDLITDDELNSFETKVKEIQKMIYSFRRSKSPVQTT